MFDVSELTREIRGLSFSYTQIGQFTTTWNFRFVDNLFNFGKDFH